MTWKVRIHTQIMEMIDRYVKDSDERLDGVDVPPISSSNEHQV